MGPVNVGPHRGPRPASGRTLAELDLRARTGASVVALFRDGTLLPSPAPDFRLQAGDRLGLIGEAPHVQAAEGLLVAPESDG